MKSLTNGRALGALGTTGTNIRDNGVALALLLGLVLAGCGGESTKADDTSGSDTTSAGAGGTQATGDTSVTGIGNSTSPSSGSFGPSITVGTASSGSSNGAGATTGTSGEDTTSVSTDGGGGTSAGASGAGGSAGAGCEAQDAVGSGACNTNFGVFFLGDHCRWISGCICEGEACDNGYPDEASCEAAHPECLDDGCAAQDVTFVGGCEPASVYVFNGIECVAMDGCGCVGNDCDATYSSLDDCKAAHAACDIGERSCSQLAAVHDDYVSHTACQDDTDCVMVWGLCGIGLGSCYHTLNRRWGAEGLDAIEDAWRAQDCGGGACACAEPPATVICDEGVCAFQE